MRHRQLKQGVSAARFSMRAVIMIISTPYLSSTDAACYLRVDQRYLITLAAASKIPHRRIGKQYVFHRDELDAWMAQQPGVAFTHTGKDSDDHSDAFDRSNGVPSSRHDVIPPLERKPVKGKQGKLIDLSLADTR
jgi:excisionase family DNA binding protein